MQFDPKMVEIFQRIWENGVIKSIIKDQVESRDEIEDEREESIINQ